jgi:outer membrane protein assembly factor BamB
VAGDTVFFGPGDGRLYAVNRRDGKLKWKLDEKANWQYVRQMYVTGNVLVAGTYTEMLYGIHVDTGKIKWRFKAGNFINSHHVAGDTAYLWSPTGWIYAIDIDTGRVRWRHQTTRYGNNAANWGPMMAEIVTFENKLYCLDMNQVLHLLDVADGQELLRVPFGHNLRPSVSPLPDSRAVVATDAGDIQLVQW